MDGLLPLILLAGLGKPNQKALFAQILPAAIPGPSTQRLAVAIVSAQEQIKSQARTEQSLVEEAIRAGELASAADLAPYPALNAAFNRLPLAAQSAVFSTTAGSTTPRRRPKGDET